MRKLLLIVPIIGLTTGCVFPAQSLSGAYPGQRSMYPRAAGPQFNLASLPVGRWDHVMMTAVGPPLLVLMKNGTMASGEVVSASSETLVSWNSTTSCRTQAEERRQSRIWSCAVEATTRMRRNGASVRFE